MVGRTHHDEFEKNQFLGKELINFSQAGFDLDRIHIRVSRPLFLLFPPTPELTLQRNAPVASLYEEAIMNEGAVISSNGALINFSGKKTGRSPKDKRIVFEDGSKDDIWWGPVNIKME